MLINIKNVFYRRDQQRAAEGSNVMYMAYKKHRALQLRGAMKILSKQVISLFLSNNPFQCRLFINTSFDV